MPVQEGVNIVVISGLLIGLAYGAVGSVERLLPALRACAAGGPMATAA